MPPQDFTTGTPAANPAGQAHLIAAIIQRTLDTKRLKTLVALSCDLPQLWVYSCGLGWGVEPEKIERLSGAIALAAGSENCRIARGPGRLFLELPKPAELRRTLSPLRLEGLKPATATSVAVGLATNGLPAWVDLANPNECHLAIGGASGSGKSILLQWIIYRLARQNDPAALRFLLLDPKGFELTNFRNLPHLLHPIESRPVEIARLLAWVGSELDRRAQTGQSSPRIVVVVDEVKDLTGTNGDIGPLLSRVAQIGRALGISLILATQQPGGRSLGEALPNLPVRLVGRVASSTLTYGATGRGKTQADALLGRGDFLMIAAGTETRLQVPLITGREFGKLPRTEHISTLDDVLPSVAMFGDRARDARGGPGRRDLAEDDYQDLEDALANGAGIEALRERFNLGYSRAKRIYDHYWGNG